MTVSAWFCKKLKICVFYFPVNVYTTVYSLIIDTILHIILHISCKMEVWAHSNGIGMHVFPCASPHMHIWQQKAHCKLWSSVSAETFTQKHFMSLFRN